MAGSAAEEGRFIGRGERKSEISVYELARCPLPRCSVHFASKPDPRTALSRRGCDSPAGALVNEQHWSLFAVGRIDGLHLPFGAQRVVSNEFQRVWRAPAKIRRGPAQLGPAVPRPKLKFGDRRTARQTPRSPARPQRAIRSLSNTEHRQRSARRQARARACPYATPNVPVLGLLEIVGRHLAAHR